MENILKVAILLIMMTLGFFLTYALIWCAMGGSVTNWMMVTCGALAALTEYGYCRWLQED